MRASVLNTCLVPFDKNRYSVDGRAVGRTGEIRACSVRVAFWQDAKILGQHARASGRDTAIHDPLRCIPVLARMPGALWNGARSKTRDLPMAIRRVQRKLARHRTADGQILKMIPIDGLDAVNAACPEARDDGGPAASAVINIRAWHPEPAARRTIDARTALRLIGQPVADCKRYDSHRRPNHGKITAAGRDEPAEAGVACLRPVSGATDEREGPATGAASAPPAGPRS